MTYPHAALTALQLGMGWFSEQPGGSNRVYSDLIRHLASAGVGIRGVVVGSHRVAAESGGMVTAAAPLAAPLPVRWLGVRRAVCRLLRDQRPDVVATHFALFAFPVLDVVRDRPLVVHFHGPWADESAAEGGRRAVVAVQAAIERAVYRRGSRLIVLSEAFGALLCRRYGVSPSRLAVVPGGVDAAQFAIRPSRRQARSLLGWPTDRPIVLAVRRLVHRMGLENLVAAMMEVRRHIPDALLLIAGKGPLTDLLRRQIADLGLEGHVALLGFVPDEALPLAYRAADLGIVPTVSLEGFGLITIESLAAGTPVLVTPIGGLPEAVRGLAPDLVLDGAEPAALADGLVRALDGRLKLPGAAACQAYVRTRFDWPVIARLTREVYREALQ